MPSMKVASVNLSFFIFRWWKDKNMCCDVYLLYKWVTTGNISKLVWFSFFSNFIGLLIINIVWLSPHTADSARPCNPRFFFVCFFLSGCIPGSRQRCSCAVSSSAGRRPCVFSILPHLAFRHATMTQWCRVTGQAGQWLFVSIQINHSLFWTDNAINVWKGHGVRSSQAWWGEWWGQRSDGNTLDWLTCIFTRRRKKNDTKKEPWWSTFSERRD